MLRNTACEVRQRHLRVAFFQLDDVSTHAPEITGDEKPLQIVGSIRIVLPYTSDRLPGIVLRAFEASPISRQRFSQLAVQNTFDLSPLPARSPGQRFDEMEAYGVQTIRTGHAQRGDFHTGINGPIRH